MGTLIVLLVVLVIAVAMVAIAMRNRRRGHVLITPPAPTGDPTTDPGARP